MTTSKEKSVKEYRKPTIIKKEKSHTSSGTCGHYTRNICGPLNHHD